MENGAPQDRRHRRCYQGCSPQGTCLPSVECLTGLLDVARIGPDRLAASAAVVYPSWVIPAEGDRGAWQIAAVALALAASSCAPDPVPLRPNVLLISIDSLRADHLGCYGYPRPTSPAIDRLAAEGAVFEVAISSSSWTLPAHAALFTGLPDSVHGCDRGSRTLAPERRTLAEAMQAAGYATAGVWSGPLLDPGFGLAQGFEAWLSHARQGTSPRADPEAWQQAAARSHADVTSPRVLERASDWLDSWSRSPGRRPFFLFLHLWDPHYDYIPPPPYDSMFDDADYSGTEDGRGLAEYLRLRDPLPKGDLEHLIALYDGEIAWTDRHVGELLDKLDALEIAGETAVVVTADHGEEFFEHGHFGHKRQLFDESIRIPLILRLPGRIPAGARRAAPVRIVDVAPTILELAGAEPLPDVLGTSLLPLFGGTTAPRSTPTISQLAQGETGDASLLAVRASDFKIVAQPAAGKVVGLWDLRRDPLEETNVYDADHELTARAKRSLQETIANLNRLRARHSVTSAQIEMPETLRRELESLGYIGVSTARFRADPNPIAVCDGDLGVTTLHWSATDAVAPLEVRVGTADGALMASVGLSGSAATGRWVTDGTRFFLMEAETGKILARTTVHLSLSGCDER